jgi:hypothetical protein
VVLAKAVPDREKKPLARPIRSRPHPGIRVALFASSALDALGGKMPGNNPNQNQSLEENHAKGPVRGFPGMNAAIEKKRSAPRSQQEVIDARIANTKEPPSRARKAK